MQISSSSVCGTVNEERLISAYGEFSNRAGWSVLDKLKFIAPKAMKWNCALRSKFKDK
jgi:hypothetical protein